MKRTLLGLFCLTLLVAWVAPSFAVDFKLNGYFRSRFIRSSVGAFTGDPTLDDDQDPVTVVDQRWRARASMGLNEYVSIVYYGEVDMQYGDVSYGRGNATRNSGGAIGADTVSMETKQLFLTVKIPETPISSTIGMQGYGDGVEGVIFNADMAGVRFDGKFDVVDVVFGWFKWDENSATGDNREDDIDLWALKVRAKPMDNLNLGGDVMWLNINGEPSQLLQATSLNSVMSGVNNGDLYYLTLDAEYSMPDMNGMFVRAWFIYNGGELDYNDGSDTDVAGWAASAQVGAKFGPVALRLRGIYFSGDDNPADGDYDSMVIPAAGETFFLYKDNLQLSTSDVYGNTVFQNGIAQNFGVTSGNGLTGLVLSGEFMPPAMQQMYVKWGLAYWTTLEGGDNLKRETGLDNDDDLGFEISARVGYKIASIVDVSLNGAYMALGGLFDNTAPDGGDPEDPWQLYAMVNVPY